jgi:tRNA A-37 threonylcarbamoyl transferase component Bud32
MPLAAGAKLGLYEIVSPLGVGGMGEVYRARDTKLKRNVAIKVVPEALSTNAEALARFEREAHAVAALNHPNILSIHDFAAEAGIVYAVTELLEGETLRELVAGGALTIRKAIDFSRQICAGLSAAHARGIVHRDLKPDNLFVTNDGRIKILDFGLAKSSAGGGSAATDETHSPTVSAFTEPGTVMGTVGYMSPEQVKGIAVDHRSDLFSFGAVLYEMLTGRRAFQRDTAAETMTAILREDPPELDASGVRDSPILDRIVRHCLEKKPEQRFQSATDIAFDLETFSGATGTRKVGSAGAPRSVSAIRLLVIPALAAVVIGAAAFLVGRGGRAGLPHFERLTYRRGTVRAARFSADGRSVYYGALWDGQPADVYSSQPGQPESKPLGLPGASFVSVSAGGELALKLRSRAWNGSLSGMLARSPVSGGAPREVVDNVVDADWAADGSIVILKDTPDLGSRIERPPGTVVFQGKTHIWRIRVSPDGNRIAFVEESGGGASLIVVDRKGARHALARLPADSGLAWSKRGDEIWYSEADSSEGSTIHAISLAGRDRAVVRLPGIFQVHDRSPDGTLLVEAVESTSNVLFRGEHDSAERPLSWLSASMAMDITRDGRTLLLNQLGGGGAAGGSITVRSTDGSPPVNLGNGSGTMFSADGRFVVGSSSPNSARATTDGNAIVLTPVGAGAPRTIAVPALAMIRSAWFFPDGKRLLILGKPADGLPRYYVMSIDSPSLRPVSPPGYDAFFGARPISPDGTRFVALIGDPGSLSIKILPVDGGEPKELAGFEQGDVVTGWSGDGGSVFAYRRNQIPIPVYRIDLNTGKRELWKELSPADSAGVEGGYGVVVAQDDHSYAYNFDRTLSTLYLVEGLR